MTKAPTLAPVTNITDVIDAYLDLVDPVAVVVLFSMLFYCRPLRGRHNLGLGISPPTSITLPTSVQTLVPMFILRGCFCRRPRMHQKLHLQGSIHIFFIRCLHFACKNDLIWIFYKFHSIYCIYKVQ